jgi:nickel-dependent lactate racemase
MVAIVGVAEPRRQSVAICSRGRLPGHHRPMQGGAVTTTADPGPDLLPPAAVVGGPGGVLTEEEVTAFVHQQLAAVDLDGRSVCVVVPDATRSCPLPLLLTAVHGALTGRVTRLTVLIALGTHAPMTEAQLARHLGHPAGDRAARYPGMTVLNHEWADPATFVSLGVISADRVAELSGGRLRRQVDVQLNRAVVEHDVALVVGPVFPHEVVGFSGGNKYFFPGVAGQEIIDLSHWLGALITSADIIGTRGTTPVRALIDEAAALVPAETLALCVVARSGSGALHAATFGEPRSAWAAAAEVSAQTHVRYLDAPVRRVLAVIPERYEDMWTAAKGFYKVEPVVADGGEVVIYAPHITRISAVHPEIEEIGYHCRDWFVGQWESYRHLHWGVLAHSTHLRGAGTWDPVQGERCRVRVTLATGIPEDVVRRAALDYLDPASVDVEASRADGETFVVPEAGEVLFRLR